MNEQPNRSAEAGTTDRWRYVRRAPVHALELLLTLIIAGLIWATWLPALVTHRDRNEVKEVVKGK